MRHFVNQNVVNNPFGKVGDLMRNTNITIGYCAASKTLFLIGNVFDLPDSQFAAEVSLIQLLRAAFQLICFIQLMLSLPFL